MPTVSLDNSPNHAGKGPSQGQIRAGPVADIQLRSLESKTGPVWFWSLKQIWSGSGV